MANFQMMLEQRQVSTPMAGKSDDKNFVNQFRTTISQIIHGQESEAALAQRNLELETRCRSQDEMFRHVIHDLVNPISAASMTIETMLAHQNAFSVEYQVKRLNTVYNTLQYMNNIVSRLLKLVSLEDKLASVKCETVALDHIVMSIVETSQALAQLKGQFLEVENMQSVTICGDDVALTQILSNLISNAIKYSPQGATTRVRMLLNPAAQVVTIEVQDEGLGLSSEDRKNLFTMYGRLSSTPTSGELSTGLGLYFSKQLTEKMGGKINAESPGKNQGSTFQIQFPYVLP